MVKIRILKGDTFNFIADMLGISPATLKSLNPQIQDVNKIYVGQFINGPDSAEARQLAASREVVWNALNNPVTNPNPTPNTDGNWGAWPSLNQTGAGLPASNVTNASAIFSNPWIIGGIGIILVALLMGKKK